MSPTIDLQFRQLWVELFPDEPWTDADTALRYMASEIRMLRADQDPMRSRDEIQRAHDVLVQVVTNPVIRAVVIDPNDLDDLVRNLEPLCWVLRHDDNRTFGQNLAAVENRVREICGELHRYPEMQYPDPSGGKQHE
jgi:hypothetical protein